MKKQITIISLMLLFILLFSVGCNDTGVDDSTTENSVTTTEGDSDGTKEPDNNGFPSYSGPSSDFIFTAESVLNDISFSSYSDFLNMSQSLYLVPALAQKFIPQGMDIWEERGWLIISGYFPDTSYSDSSILLAVDMKSGAYVGEYYLTNPDSTPHASHAGGVAVTSKNIFISNDSKLYRISLESLLETGQCGKLAIEQEISVPVRASFCNYSGGYLWVGDFYYGTSYPTDEYRHMKNREGKTYYAWSVGYELDPQTEDEIKVDAKVDDSYATPDVVLSIDERIQGFAVMSDDTIALSQSYGRTNKSTIFLYKNPIGDTPHTTVTLNGKSVPTYFLDSKISCKKVTAPPMSEGLAAMDGELYILFESGADKYANGGGKDPTEHVWKLSE